MTLVAVVSVVYGLLFWLASAVLIGGVAYKIWQYWRIPVPLSIPTMPAPRSALGVVWRISSEVLWFRSLLRADKWLWCWSLMFHWSLWLVLWQHTLFFNALLETVSPYTSGLQWLGQKAGLTLFLGLAGLWLRRFWLERVRYISAPSDHLMLALLTSIAATGLWMNWVSPVNVIQVRQFLNALPAFGFFQGIWLPDQPIVWLHLLLVIVLMLVFPISKLLHAPGIFFSPTRQQWDNTRRKSPHE